MKPKLTKVLKWIAAGIFIAVSPIWWVVFPEVKLLNLICDKQDEADFPPLSIFNFLFAPFVMSEVIIIDELKLGRAAIKDKP